MSDAAHRVEKACLEKMLQFEDDVGTGKVKQAFILGLGKIILVFFYVKPAVAERREWC